MRARLRRPFIKGQGFGVGGNPQDIVVVRGEQRAGGTFFPKNFFISGRITLEDADRFGMFLKNSPNHSLL
jgi:hypothetical protein